MDKKNRDIGLIVIIVAIILLSILSGSFNLVRIITFFIFCYFINNLVNKSTKEFAIFEIIFFVGFLQMIFLPIIQAENMINIIRYLSITVIGFLLFYLGCNIGRVKLNFHRQEIVNHFSIKKNRRISYVFIILGLLGLIIPEFTKNPLWNVFSNFTFIGLAFSMGLLTLNWKKYGFFLLFYFLILLFSAIRSTIFASLISYGLLTFVYFSVSLNLNKKQLLAFMLVGLFMINLLQNVKSNYRSMVWSGDQRDYSFSLFVESLFLPQQSESMGFDERSNAGATISMIYDYVPEKYPHTYGAQFLDDFSNGILPRIFFPEKKDVDTQANFIRYTGIMLPENVSVGINVFGVSYAEFGVIGSWIFMFLFGRTLCLINNFYIKRYAKRNVFGILLFPILFLTFIKFEEEFVGQIIGWIRIILVILLFLFWNKIRKLNYVR